MTRKLVFVAAAAALAASTLGIAPAGASNQTPAGTIRCTYGGDIRAGSMRFDPSLGRAPGKTINVKAYVRDPYSTCDNSGVTPGTSRYPITRVSVKMTPKLPPGSTCASLGSTTAIEGRAQVKFLGVNPRGHYVPAAIVNKQLDSVVVSGDTFTFTTAPSTQGAFIGQTITINADAVDVITGLGCTDNFSTFPITGKAYISGTVTSP